MTPIASAIGKKQTVTPLGHQGEPYDIVYRESFSDLTSLLPELYETRHGRDGFYSALCIVSDSNVAPLYAEALQRQLSDLAPTFVYVLEAGEAHKQLSALEPLYRFLLEHHFDRHSLLLALGGGVTGDMTGFAASCYMRGIDYVQIPSSLLAQADSSIGGKTGVDLGGAKNIVGSFKMPALVYMDLSLLRTLDERQFACGMAEIVKHGLIRDRAYLDWLLENRDRILAKDTDILSAMLYESCRIKREVVEEDPFEKGVRMILNFGHTLGHAIEKESGFTLTHGECVALGSAAALYLSCLRDYIDAADCSLGTRAFTEFSLPVTIREMDEEAVLRASRDDKKNRGGAFRFILLKQLGEAFTATDVTEAELRDALAHIRAMGE